MRVTVAFRPRRQAPRVVELAEGATVGDLLASVGESRDHTLAVRGGRVAVESEALRDGDEVQLLSAFSGG